jgi:DNA-binding CsgD family transcriptional regulator
VSEDLIEQIYEAAFVPEHWPAVLDRLTAFSGSASAAMLIIDGKAPPRWKSTEYVRESLHRFTTTDAWRHSERSPHLLPRLDRHGFTYDCDYLSPEQMARDPVSAALRQLGLAWQLGTFIQMPSGDNVVFTLERWIGDGRHAPEAISDLDALRPHLARAGLMAARLGLERARTAVATLETIGYPAAVLTHAGVVLAANASFEGASPALVRFTAHGGIAIADPAADVLWRAALEGLQVRGAPLVQSIPAPSAEGRAAAVIHLLPLRGDAYDIFSGAVALTVIARVAPGQGAPDQEVLRGLFDLSPAEARLAAALTAGQSLKQAAAESNLRISTARSYLEAVFRKTGAHQQSQLVALLKSAHRPGGESAAG